MATLPINASGLSCRLGLALRCAAAEGQNPAIPSDPKQETMGAVSYPLSCKRQDVVKQHLDSVTCFMLDQHLRAPVASGPPTSEGS